MSNKYQFHCSFACFEIRWCAVIYHAAFYQPSATQLSKMHAFGTQSRKVTYIMKYTRYYFCLFVFVSGDLNASSSQ